MSGRTSLIMMSVSWLGTFVVLTAVEYFTFGLEPGSVPGDILLSFFASPLVLGLAYLWLRRRTQKMREPDEGLGDQRPLHA